MNLKIQENSSNYACEIVQIAHLSPIEGADKIQKCIVSNQTIIVSKEVKIGDVMALFVSGSQLSHDYCYENSLYENKEINKDVESKGFINSKRRVRALKLRGIISEGMLMPLSSFDYIAHLNEFEIGDRFTCIEDINVVQKYVVEQKVIQGSKEGVPKTNKLKNIIVDGQFKFHTDTSHLERNIHQVSPSDFAVITEKIHGASIILAKLLTHKTLTWKDKIAQFFGIDVVSSHFKGIWSSGKPKSNLVKGVEDLFETTNPHYYNEDIWKKAYDKYSYAIEPGISLYGELCHNTQKGYDYSKLNDMVVYKITRTNSEGNVDVFSWDMVEKYCQKYDLQTVPVLYKGYISNLRPFSIIDDNFSKQFLEYLSINCLEKYCQYCTNKVPNEGICIQVGNNVYKYKSKMFKLHEDKQQEIGEIDIESE